jgi:hypothetical protein
LGAAATEVPSLELKHEQIRKRKVCVECEIWINKIRHFRQWIYEDN